VVSTGFMQFIVTMIGFWMLAVFAIVKTGGIGTIVETVNASDWGGRNLNVMPSFSSVGLPLATVIFLFTLRPIEQACAGQALAQRLFSVKSTRDATKVALIFATIYYALIPLPWIITIIASKAYMPGLTDGESAYPIMAMKVLPVGFKGLLIAAMMAAFMSTYATQLNWGGSYLINDLYKRFFKPDGSARHYAFAGQVAAIPMALLSAGLAYTSESVLNLLLYIMTFQAGIWTVNLGRWIWWRVSSISEVAALCGSIVMFGGLWIFRPEWVHPSNFEQYWGICMAIIMIGTAVIWIIVTLLTKPTEERVIDDFYRSIQPLGWWKPIRERLGMQSPYKTKSVIYGWVVNLVAMYSCLIGLLKLVFGNILLGAVFLGVGLVAVVLAFHKANTDPILEEYPDATKENQ
jgi:Na+/proline symporter